MKYALAAVTTLALSVSKVIAFPAAVFEETVKRELEGHSGDDLRTFLSSFDKQKRQSVSFNAEQQYVSNKGANAFVPPTNVNTFTGDQRGPCPGLNALANHNYLPHNGVATINQLVDATYEVFGMANNLGGFLSLYGAIFDGNLGAWSIGGPSSQLPSLALALSQPQGISGSHNKYEADVSPVRPDLYQYGNDYKVVLSQFQELFDLQPDPATANYNLDVLNAFRSSRFSESIAKNPYFFNGPFSGVIVQPAAYSFIYRFFGNKSAEYPEGILNQDVLKSFFAITGESGNFTWTEGHEAIPDNWYKRAIGDEYDLIFLLSDLLAAALEYPEFLSVGGNTGTVNSFTPVNIDDLTGGLYNTQTLAQGDNLACFIQQVILGATPDILKGTVNIVSNLLSEVQTATTTLLGSVLPGLTCPELTAIDASQFSSYPGYTKSPSQK